MRGPKGNSQFSGKQRIPGPLTQSCRGKKRRGEKILAAPQLIPTNATSRRARNGCRQVPSMYVKEDRQSTGRSGPSSQPDEAEWLGRKITTDLVGTSDKKLHLRKGDFGKNTCKLKTRRRDSSREKTMIQDNRESKEEEGPASSLGPRFNSAGGLVLDSGYLYSETSVKKRKRLATSVDRQTGGKWKTAIWSLKSWGIKERTADIQSFP